MIEMKDDEPECVRITRDDFYALMTEKLESIPHVIARVEAEFADITSTALGAGARRLVRALRQQERAIRFNREHLGPGPWHVSGPTSIRLVNSLRAYDEDDIAANIQGVSQGDGIGASPGFAGLS